MNCYKLKINDKFIKGFRETEIDGGFMGEGWHNHSKRAVNIPIYGSEKEALVIEGRINLKSYMDKVTLMMKDGFDVDSVEFIKVGEI